MKKFLFLTIAVFLVLVVSMALYTPVAKADSPAEFVVGITRRSNTGVETPVLNAIVTARVVRKGVYLNRPGWPYKQLPLASYPNGSHLDSDDSGTPDTNDEALFPTISWYQWGLASKNDYIWCGAAGGVQEGQFEVDVDIADGRWPPYLGQGHWEYQWFEKYGGATYVASGVQQGTKARVQAVNPRQTSVWFTFVEDPPPSPPPPPEPDPKVGSITIAKRGYFEAGELSELKIGETLQRGQVLISPDRSKKLVMQEDGNLAVYIYHGPIWQAAVQGSNRLAFQSDGNLALWKDNADGTATALWSSGSSGALGTVLRMQDDGNLVMYNGAYNGAPAVWYSRMQKYWNGTNTFFAEYAGGTSAPVNSGDYLFNSLANTNSHLATSNEVATAQVLVSNAYPLTGTSVFHSSQANPSTVNGVWMYPDYYATGGTQQPYWTTVQVPAGKQFVKAQICINGKCSDNTSTVICTGANKTGTCTLPGLTVLNGTTTYVDWWMAPIPVAIQYYPWLQTKNGDVTSGDYQNVKGKIIGQKIGSATDSNNRRGARRGGTGTAAATVAESSFVVAATDAGDYFCAQERFVLGKSLADRDNFDDGSCKTGGYAPSPVNFDKVKASIAKAYADNSNGVLVPAPGNRCAPKYATSAVATAASLSATLGLGCPTGG
ncbi:MAG: hypothetical protein NT114_03565, partial [Patescibacteria group bacterium]|nr:hypothetical protein [Patescibacteria group bacterium]